MRKFTPILFGAVSAASLAFAGAAIAQTESNPPKSEQTAKGSTTRAKVEQRADAMFARMDANKDGVLNAADRDARVAERFAKLDTNNDGALSLDEFKTRPARASHDAAAPGSDAKKHRGHGKFGKRHMGHRGHRMGGRMADADKDGQVTAAEFKAAALARFDRLDTDKDGTVTSEERKAAMQKWREQRKQARADRAAPAK